MKELVSRAQCYGCEACVQACGNGAIRMEPDELGFRYPVIDGAKCSDCARCKAVCPALQTRKAQNMNIKVMCAYTNDTDARRQSSSGGMFHAVSQWIFQKGGVVFGAAFDENFLVRHTSVENMEQLSPLRKSKYLQSRIENTYAEAKRFLEAGRWVLYVGTSCQIAGLHLYLAKEYERLLTIDFVCGGNFSPYVWRLYLDGLQKKYNSRIVSADFRDKGTGSFMDFRLNINFANGESFCELWKKNAFINGAFSKLYTRSSCYQCQYKSMNSGSDFTCGDMLWKDYYFRDDFGVAPSEREGCSVLIQKTDKAAAVFNEIKEGLAYREISIQDMEETFHLFRQHIKHEHADRFAEKIGGGYDGDLGKFIWKNLAISGKSDMEELGARFGIFGSYNTRAVLRKLVNDRYQNKMIYQITKTSLISQYSEPAAGIDKKEKSKLSFRQEMVENDLQKSYRLNLQKYMNDIDVLLVDFLDERFDVGKIKNQPGYITVSDAHLEMYDGYKGCLCDIEILSEDERERLWKKACDQWIAAIRQSGKQPQTILFKHYLTEEIGCNGVKIESFGDRDRIRQINSRLEKYYRYFAENFPEAEVIESENETWNYCDVDHKYGCLPEHMSEQAYEELADQLYQCLLSWR